MKTGATETETTGQDRNWLIFLAACGYLIASFLWRVLTPAHEYAMRDELYLTMGLDLLCIVGLVGLKMQVQKGQILFWIALVAGLGLFGIRMTGDAAWWTGHLVYYLEPR
jgi:hypothetical protein